jgi:hypothetical protein
LICKIELCGRVCVGEYATVGEEKGDYWGYEAKRINE